MRMFLLLICSFVLLSSQQLYAESQPSVTAFKWRTIEPGYGVARYALSGEQYFLKSEVILLKFSPKFFTFINSVSKSERSDIQTLANVQNAVAGINTNFFDTSNKPLGLIVDDSKQLNKIHLGGSLLTGIFEIKNQTSSNQVINIIHRKDYKNKNVTMAFQAGPRLINKGKPLSIKSKNVSSRRSGVAINKDGEIIIFATLLRFPGASLAQIQQMLLDPRLAIVDALNLDGGGSSQLFIKNNVAIEDDTTISGGDLVPSALVVIRK